MLINMLLSTQVEIVRLLGPVRLGLRSLTLQQLADDLTHLPHWILSNVSLTHLTIQTTSLKVFILFRPRNETQTTKVSFILVERLVWWLSGDDMAKDMMWRNNVGTQKRCSG